MSILELIGLVVVVVGFFAFVKYRKEGAWWKK